MNPFYALNKTLDDIRNEPTQEQKALVESQAPKSPAKKTLEEALRTDLRSLMEDATGGMSGSNTLEGYPPVMTPSDEKYKQALARVYGQQILRNPKFPDLLARLKRSTPNERDLDLIIRNGTLPNHLEEAEKSLSQAAKTVKKGALHKQEGIPQDEKIGNKKLQSLKKSGTPLEKKRANFALNIQGKGKKKVNEWGGDPNDLSNPNSMWHQGGKGAPDRDPKQHHYEMIESWSDAVLDALVDYGFEIPVPEQQIDQVADKISNDLDCPVDIVKHIIVGSNDQYMHDNNVDECGMYEATPDELDQQTIAQKNRAAKTRKNSRAVQQKPAQDGPRRSEIPAFIRKGRGDPGLDHNDLEETNMYSESDKDILNYLKAKLAPAGKATSQPYNGSAGDADAYNGMEFEDDEGTGKFDKREISPGRTQYTRKANTFVDVNDPDQKSTSDGPRGRGRPAGSTGGGGARLKGTHVAKHVMKNREREVDEAGFGDYEPEQGTGKFDKRVTSTGTVYTRKPETYVDVNDPDQKSASDEPRGRGRPAGSTGGGGARLKGTHVAKHVMKNREREVDEGDVEDFVDRGGKVTQVPPNDAPHRPGVSLGSKHIGTVKGGKAGNISGKRANTRSTAKPIVAVEGGDDCPHCGQAMPAHGKGREVDMEGVKGGMGHFVKAAKKVGGVAKVLANRDYDGDGKIETGKEEHAGSVDKAIKANKDKPKAKKTEEGKGDGNLANNAKPYDKVTQGDVVAGRLGKDEEGGKKKAKKEEKVDETTTTGSVATSSGGKSSGGGMSFGGSIYDSWERKYSNLLKEDVNVSTNSSKNDGGEEVENITINVSGDDVARIKEMLHSMGVSHGDEAGHEHGGEEPCDTCGGVPCQCDDMEEGTVGSIAGGGIGGAAGAALGAVGGPVGALAGRAIGSTIGSAIGDKVTGESDVMDESAAPFEIGDKVIWRQPSGARVRGVFKGMKDGVAALIYSHPSTVAIPLSNVKSDQGENDGDLYDPKRPNPTMEEEDDAGHQRMMELAGLGEANVTYSNNEPDYPSNQEYADTQMITRGYAGGGGAKEKSTGQATLPVVASQVNRLHSHVSEGQRMNDLYKTIQAIENKEV